MKNNRTTSFRVGAALLLAGLLPFIGACNKNEAAPLPPRGVIAFELKSEGKGGGNVYSGEVRPRVETALGFRIAGKLIERRAELGQEVKAGQLLARLDRTDPALAAQAAGNQRAAAEAELELARADAKRFESLRGQNFVSQAALDGKLTALKAADNRAAAARAQADTAGNQAGYADLVADASGVISAVLAEPGQVLAVGAPVYRIARQGAQEKEVLISVAENQVQDFAKAREVAVSLWADSAKTYRGRVREISPQADPVTRTFAVRIALLDADPAVRLGMTASVTQSGAASNILQVPAPSIVQQNGKPAVWVLGEGGSITLRPVEVAAFREDGVILSGGVKPGEKIVAAGGHKLIPGERVRILETR
jgi:membrane fusion protein, multidrug efflux system